MTATVLAIDTSTSRGGVAVVDGNGEVLFEETFVANRSHNSEFVEPLQNALNALGDQRLDRVVVGTGPGSYTGIRIGISAAMGVAMSREAALVGLPSVCAVAGVESYSVVGDARRGASFVAEIAERKLVGAPRVVDAAEFVRLEGAVFTFDEKPILEDLPQVNPEAAILAVIVARMNDGEIEQLAGAPVEPIYLRAPFITEPKKMGKAVPGAPA
ncbi:MAG: tRNA (adenosine(37)-N6)-threonylcarbamoyltransferase complex dimerization subunit type 1 TsaB [Verrucomicrobiota bacterium]